MQENQKEWLTQPDPDDQVKPEQTEQPSEKPGEQTVANETPQETEENLYELEGDGFENDSDE